MDIFKQKRYLWFTVIFLALINLSTLTLLWIGRPEGPKPQRGPVNPAEKQNRIQHILKQELGFDETQVEQYLKLREKHRKVTRQLEVEIQELKREMFDEVLKENPQPILSDSLLTLIQTKQSKFEHLTFQHFLDLRNLCGPEQQQKLKLLMHEVFRQGPPPAGDADGPSPPKHGDRQRPPHPPSDEAPPPPPGN